MIFPKVWIICRVCLKQQDEMFNLFDDTTHNNIWALLRDCSGLPVRRNDSLPDKICEICLARLWKATSFRIDCQRSHRELLQKQMESDTLLYEEEYSAEFLKMSRTSSDEYAEEDQPIPTYLEQVVKFTSTEIIKDTNNEDDIKDEIAQQYCIVPSNKNMETTPQCDNDSKQPIVLLLRLKNISNGSSQMEAVDLQKPEGETKTSADVQKWRNSLIETENKTVAVNNANVELKSKEVKIKSKIVPVKNIKTKFTCNICKKICKTKELLRHHSYIHKRPHNCKVCHKKFSQSHSFLSHINCHTGIKPYYCRMCLETFSDISNRNNHERLQHKERNFQCNSCTKSFRLLALLQKHSNCHKPKKCFICDRDFASVRLVRMHHRRKHLKFLDYNY